MTEAVQSWVAAAVKPSAAGESEVASLALDQVRRPSWAAVLDQRAADAALYSALARAQKECRQAELDGKFEAKGSKGGSYAFTSANERLAVAREAFAKNGLALVRAGRPTITSTVKAEVINRETGEVVTRECPVLEQGMWLLHEGGARIETGFAWPVVVETYRPLDKAVAGADTAGLSYLLRDLLMMASDPKDEEDERGKVTQMPTRPPAPAAMPNTAPVKAPTPAPVTGIAGPAPAVATAPAVSAGAAGPGAATSPVASAPAPAAAVTAAPGTAATAPVSAPAPSAPVGGEQLLPEKDVFEQEIAKGSLAGTFAAEQAGRAKLAGAGHAAAKLYALQPDQRDRELFVEIFAVGAKRFGSREAALAAMKQLGATAGQVPTVAELKKFVEAMPS